ncbi:MAG: RNA methyltransferase, partial [Anaerolineae bacterium]|nr:RNA methyltransferase [Anaerolineae bacterium]
MAEAVRAMITSTGNDKVKRIRLLNGRAKKRREMGSYVIEGVRLAEEALAAELQPEFGLYSEGLSERGMAAVADLEERGVRMETAAEHVMSSASDTKAPQGIVLVMKMEDAELPEKIDLCLIADRIKDPGNLGTMLRSAAAAGAQAVFLLPGN